MTRAICRRLVARALGRVLPADALDGILGDLDEEFVARAAASGRVRAEWWMLREACSVVRAYRQSRPRRQEPRRTIFRDLAAGLADSFRHCRRAPGYTMLAAGSLGLAVAAIVSTTSVTALILTQPIARSAPDRVQRLASVTTAGSSAAFSFPELEAIDGAIRGAGQLSAVALTPALLRIGDVATQDLIDVSVGALHNVVGVAALRGRLLTADDDRPGRPRVLVVSETFWRAYLLGADDAIGRDVHVNGLAYTVVGVAPTMPSLGFFGVAAAGWVPAATADSLLTRGWRTDADDRAFIALVRSDRSPPDAQIDARLARAAADLAREWPGRWRERRLERTGGLLVSGSLRTVALLIASLLSAMAALLLVVAATNVGGLVFAQASTRRRALAIRSALGARPATLVVGTLAEGVLLGGLAAVVALALYGWFAQLAQSIQVLPTITLRLDLPWTIGTIVLTAAIAVFAGLATTLGPAFSVSRLAGRSSALDALSSRQSGGSAASRTQRWLLSAQVAATVVLVVGATLFTRSLGAIGDTSVGVDIDRLAAFDLDIEPAGVAPEAMPALANAILERLRSLPGVSAVAMASRAPVDQSTPAGDVRTRIESRDVLLRDVTRVAVTPGYFDTVGMRLRDGRSFADTDTNRPVAVINETMARRIEGARTFTDEGTGTAYDVIGVAADAKYRTLQEPAQPHFYTPSGPQFHMAILVRAEGDPAALFGDVQRALDGVGPGVQGFFPRTGRDHLRPLLLPSLIAAGVSRALGVVAGVLATIGLFGLLSWLVQARRHEWGLRMAIGASPGDIRRLVMKHAWRAAWPGALAGLAIAVAAGSFARERIFGITVLDPALLVIVPATVVGVVIAAGWLPARRATKVSAVDLLR